MDRLQIGGYKPTVRVSQRRGYRCRLIVNKINPGQPFLWVDVLGWREIFRMIQASSCDVDLVRAPVRLVR